MADQQSGFFVEITQISSMLDSNTLRELFGCCGEIKHLDMRRDARNQNQRVCIIQFASKAEMDAAALLTGTQLGDCSLKVEKKDFTEVKNMILETEKHTEAGQSTGTSVVDEVEKARKQVEAWANAHPEDTQKTFLTDADRKREAQIKRTIYVGNLHPQIGEGHIRAFFSTQGEIKDTKMSVPASTAFTSGATSEPRYCFVEFETEESAQRAFALTGTILGDRPVKIGRATTPIYKSDGVPTSILSNPVRLSNAMSHVRCALEALNKKKGHVAKKEPTGPQSNILSNVTQNKGPVDYKDSDDDNDREERRRSRKRRRRRRTPSRSRSRSSRSRSRSRRREKRRRRRRRSRSRERSFDRPSLRSSRMWRRTNSGPSTQKRDMVWDGFQWHPKDSAEGRATKMAAEVGARGPQVGKSPGYAQNGGQKWDGTGKPQTSMGLGAQLAQEALKNLMAPPGI